MRDLLFHVGLHKTATTYLQHVALANRARLAAAGVELAPFLHPGEGNHYPLIRALRAEGFAPAAFERALETIAAAAGERLLVTAEELCTTILAYPERAAALRAAASRRFRPRILVTLRRQDHLQESIFGQAARTWYSGDIRGYSHYNLDHDARLRAIEAVFGRENVTVTIYKERGGDVLGDFLAALGVAVDRASLVPVPPRNLSLHRRQILFMAALPKDPRASRSRDHMHLPTRIARLLRESDAIADDGGRGLLSPRERHDLVARHLPGNRALVARHGLGAAAVGDFLDLPDPEAPWAPPAPITVAERRAALRAVMRGLLDRRNLAAALADGTRAGAAVLRMARP
jgi:hypothetical protein